MLGAVYPGLSVVFGRKVLVESPQETLLYGAGVAAAVQFLWSLFKGHGKGHSALTIVLSVLLTPAVFLVLVVFGAPLYPDTGTTLLCALHVSLLALQPLILEFGLAASEWQEVARLQHSISESYGGLVGAVLGLWLGAIPIVLDWDRDWQRWPVTLVVGSYIGNCLGSVLGYLFRQSGEESLPKKVGKSRRKASKSTR